jgi:aspartyl-tRNA(Asn)/glutamyl-tRNA(Gln) amidotransferase subunit A
LNYPQKIDQLKNGSLSLTENVNSFLTLIEQHKNLNIFNSIFHESVQQAESIAKKINSGKYGKLAGMVLSIKDVLAIKNKPLTCSSKSLKNFTSLFTATSIRKLLEEDAIIIGKTNCDEFAMGSSNENSFFGNVLNPVDNTRVPGGSSGGSAAAVKAGLCDASLGTDTGGSVRQPASFCGVFGLKPTYSRISRFGLTSFASSFDTVGIFANNTEDIAIILEVISGYDELDSTSSKIKIENFFSNLDSKRKYKIGIPKEYFAEGLSGEVTHAINKLIAALKKNNYNVEEISLPHTEFTIAAYYILTTAEASSNLARYDGVRYGYRSEKSFNLDEMFTKSRYESFGDEVKRRIMLGTYVLSSGYYNAYYLKAQKVRRKIKEDFDNAFNIVNIILTPTTPTTAYKIGEKINNPLEMYLGDIYTTSANLAGIPGINIPIGLDSNGLPIGLQLLSNQFEEQALLNLSQFIQNNIL